MAGKKWTENYNKFDHLDSDESDDEKPKSKKPSSTLKPTSLDGSPVVHPTYTYDYQQDDEFWSEKSRIKSLPQNPSEVWQITCCKLRCWTSLPEDLKNGNNKGEHTMIRPWAVLVAGIYPAEGLLLGYDVNATHPHIFPSASSTACRLARIMMDPPSGTQRRPGKVVCDDASLGSDLYYALASLRVDCMLMSAMPEATRVHADAVSTLLCKAGGASQPEEGVAMMGTMLQPSVPPQVYEHLSYAAASLVVGPKEVQRLSIHGKRPGNEIVANDVEPDGDEYFSAEEEEELEPAVLSLESEHVPPWLAVLPGSTSRHSVLRLTLNQEMVTDGKTIIEAGETVWVGLLHDDDGILGIALFWSRLDCEARMKDPTVSMQQVHRPYIEQDQCALLLHLSKLDPTSSPQAQSGQKVKLKRTKPRSYDIRSGSELCYNSAQSLKEHWPAVRKWSKPLSERDDGLLADRRSWHPRGEVVLLFREHSSVTFQDWEYADQINYLVLSGSNNRVLAAAMKLGRSPHSFFPLPIALKPNTQTAAAPSFCPCEVADLCWLTMASQIVNKLPLLLHELQHSNAAVASTMNSIPQLGNCDIRHNVELPYSQVPNLQVTVSLDPVLLSSEAQSN